MITEASNGTRMSSNIVMNKSQLRKLAREYALGNLEEDEYRQRRRALVDDITGGKVAILREVPPPPREAYAEDPTTKVSIGGGPGVRRMTSTILFIVLVVLAGVVWMLLPTDRQESRPIAGVGEPAQAPPVSRARTLIDEFVAQEDFSAFSIASFKESWSHLTYTEKREAYASHWFNELIDLISDEIKAQNALVGSEESGKAVETGRRLSQFASFLGISEYVTRFKGAPERSAAATLVDTDKSAEPAPLEIDNPQQQPAPIAPEVSGSDRVDLVPETEWLSAQPDEAYTLQLFAANQLDAIEKLVSANADVELQVLVSTGDDPHYRVVHGVFDSEGAARNAYARLPEDIRAAQPVPMVKSLTSLRDEIGNNNRVAGLDENKFTLQVFATDNVVTARRLQDDYPALDLSLLETANPYSRYRILYGSFDSEDMAKKAAGGLPPELLQDLGDPLIKTMRELRAVKP